MKVIGVKNNYAANGSTVSGNRKFPDVFFMADSSIIKTNNPLFLPEFASSFALHTAFVFRACRLGKHIPLKFAHRYIDAVTAGFAVEAQAPTALPDGSPLLRAFDGAATLGDFVTIDDSMQSLDDLCVSSAVNGQEMCQATPAGMTHGICEIVHELSKVCTIKIGDLFFVLIDDINPVNIKIGDTVTAAVNGEEKLRIRIK